MTRRNFIKQSYKLKNLDLITSPSISEYPITLFMRQYAGE